MAETRPVIAVADPSRPPVLAYALGDALYLNLTSACTLACTFCDMGSGGATAAPPAPPTGDRRG